MCYKYYSFLLAWEDCALSYAASKASYYIVAFKFQWKRSKFGFLCCFILTKFFEDILKLRKKNWFAISIGETSLHPMIQSGL